MIELVEQMLLVCPKNDEESVMILKIAEKAGIPVLISKQPHGARLSREKELLEAIQSTDVKTVVIVEIPGPEEEEMLRQHGYEAQIIDHHRYDDVDRMKPVSSLEQFLSTYEISDAELEQFGFDPLLVKGVAAMDRGFIWEMRSVIPENRWQDVIDYYRSLSKEVNRSQREVEERLAREVWEQREERDGILVVRSPEDRVSIRDALSYLIAETYNKPTTTVIVQGNRRVYAQETDAAETLQDTFGGFTFGGGRCWGILKEDGNLPDVEEVIRIINASGR